ncbi:MAG: hypothetical protein WD042_05680 [Phycisphaeraceae bacterium]
MPLLLAVDPVSQGMGLLLLVFITILGLLGIVLLVTIGLAWRRHMQRLARQRKREHFMPDIWQTGGDRLLSQIERESHPPLPPNGPQSPEAPDFPDDPNDDDQRDEEPGEDDDTPDEPDDPDDPGDRPRAPVKPRPPAGVAR